MKKPSMMVLAAALGFSASIFEIDRASAAAVCPAGYIRCSQWCTMYRPHLAPSNYYACFRGHPLSCVKLHGSLSACVRDIPPRR